MEKILVVGTGGHAHSVLALIERQKKFTPIGFVDSFRAIGQTVYGMQVLGDLGDVVSLCESHKVTRLVVAIGDNHSRSLLTDQIKNMLPVAKFPALVDPSAVVASDAILYDGVVIMPLAHVGPGCVIKEGVLVNTNASLDHDSMVESFGSLAPGVVTGGSVRIGKCSAICIGSNVTHRITIGDHTVVGAGSLVLANLPAGVVAYGSPASIVRSRMPNTPYL